jgi:twitching motility protein PilT
MAFEIDAALRYVVEREGSDLHLKAASPPMSRIHGALRPIEGSEPLTPSDTESTLQAIADERHLAEFADQGEVDFSYEVANLARFRVSAFRQRGHVSIALRAIPYQIRTIEDLGLPEVVSRLAEEPRGIILLTGTTGSGKSTTLAAMIDQINSTKSRHVVTLEDPIEYLHRDKLSIINQREVGADTHSFARAMRRVLRQDPDVILIGEMRDEETVRTALAAAETGHLVMSTLHTLDATETINRIIDFFPPRHRPRPGSDPEPAGDRTHHRGDRRGRVLRDADLRPGTAEAGRRRDRERGDRLRGRLEPARLQADARRARPAGKRDRAGHRGRRGARRLTSVRKALAILSGGSGSRR